MKAHGGVPVPASEPASDAEVGKENARGGAAGGGELSRLLPAVGYKVS